MKYLLVFFFAFSGTALLNSLDSDYGDDNRFFVVYFYITKEHKENSHCYSAVGGGQTSIIPETVADELRRDFITEKKARLSASEEIEAEYDYVVVKKNDWVITVEHELRAGDCKDEIRKVRDLISFSADVELTDELIDQKVKKSVTYLWWKDDKYIRYRVIQRSQPITNENSDLINKGIRKVKEILLEKMTEEERNNFEKKYNSACMCVRG